VSRFHQKATSSPGAQTGARQTTSAPASSGSTARRLRCDLADRQFVRAAVVLCDSCCRAKRLASRSTRHPRKRPGFHWARATRPHFRQRKRGQGNALTVRSPVGLHTRLGSGTTRPTPSRDASAPNSTAQASASERPAPPIGFKSRKTPIWSGWSGHPANIQGATGKAHRRTYPSCSPCCRTTRGCWRSGGQLALNNRKPPRSGSRSVRHGYI